MKKTPWIMLALLSFASPALATDWYIDGAGGNNHNYGSLQAPFHDFWFATHIAKPGDIIHLLPTTTYAGLYIAGAKMDGTADAPIIIRGEGSTPMTRITNGGGKNFAVYVDGAHYITFENLDVTGNESAFFIKNSTHITVSHTRAHDSGNSGIQTVESDDISILNNIVYNNAWNSNSGSFGSGISMLWNANKDKNSPDYKMIISGNIIYHNYNTPRKAGAPCNAKGDECNVYGQDSDGSGIIIDRGNGSIPALLQHSTAAKEAYNGKTLISNNVIFDNGGRGIHIYKSDHVEVLNNTVYLNNQDPYEASWHPGEIMAVESGDVAIINNIAYSDGGIGTALTGSHVSIGVENAPDGAGPITLSYNLLYNSKHDDAHMVYIPPLGSANGNKNTVTFDQHNIWGDPLFVHPSIHAAEADFHLRNSSPALGAANAEKAPETNLEGSPRSLPPTIGAY